MVSPPPDLPVLGLEGAPQGQNHLSLAKSAVFPAELSRSFSEPRQPKMELYYYTAAALYIPGTVLWVGESLSNDSLYSKSGCEALKTQHSQKQPELGRQNHKLSSVLFKETGQPGIWGEMPQLDLASVWSLCPLQPWARPMRNALSGGPGSQYSEGPQCVWMYRNGGTS